MRSAGIMPGTSTERAVSARPPLFRQYFSLFPLNFSCFFRPVLCHQSDAGHGDGLRFDGVSRASTNRLTICGDPGLGECRGIARSSTTSFMLRLPHPTRACRHGRQSVPRPLRGQWLAGRIVQPASTYEYMKSHWQAFLEAARVVKFSYRRLSSYIQTCISLSAADWP